MDSLTQFALGATISTLCLGRSLGPRKAAILGGALGTLPDLDVLIPFDGPVDSFVLHRGWTHALAVHALAAPVIGEALVRFSQPLRDRRFLVWWTVFLCLSTHAIIDAMTVYGTRLFWPFHPDPVGAGSIFIIDPLYTLPLLVVVVWALARPRSPRLKRAAALALAVSTSYMALGAVVQNRIEARAQGLLADAGIETDEVFAIAAPFTIAVWKVIALEQDRYHNLYLSVFDGAHEPPIHSHRRFPELISCLDGIDAFEKLEWFSRGYYGARMEGDRIVVSDLRMGLTPNYAFSFAIAEVTGNGVRAVAPRRAATARRTAEGDPNWLWQRVLGRPATRPEEAGGGDQGRMAAPPTPC